MRETVTSDHSSFQQGDTVVINGVPHSIDGLVSRTQLMLKPWPWYKRAWFYVFRFVKRIAERAAMIPIYKEIWLRSTTLGRWTVCIPYIFIIYTVLAFVVPMVPILWLVIHAEKIIAPWMPDIRSWFWKKESPHD